MQWKSVFGTLMATSVATIAAAQDPQPERGGTLVYTLGADPSFTNPALTSDPPVNMVGCVLYEGLTSVTNSGDVKPRLARSWQVSADGLTYSFELVSAKWHDGKPFTSADVKFSLLQVNAKFSPVFAASGRAIESIDTPAPDKVTIKLKRPFGPLLRTLDCVYGGAIVPEHVFKDGEPQTNPASSDQPVGTGPFKFEEWRRGDAIRLVRNDEYWDTGKPYLDGLVAKIVPQPTSRTQALLNGETDYVSYFYLAPNDYPKVDATDGTRTALAQVPPGIDTVFFNNEKAPFTDHRVRQALMLATDRAYLLKAGFGGHGAIGTMPFTNRLEWARDSSVDYEKMYPFDSERAGKLLDEAGLPLKADGTRFGLTLVYAADDADFALVSIALKSMWARVGVTVNIEAVERTVQTKRYMEGGFDVGLSGYTSFGDPALGMSRIFLSTSIGRPFANFSRYSNPEIDDLLAKGEQGVSLEQRGSFYSKAQSILAVELPVLTIHERILFDGMSASVQGLENEHYFPTWREAWIKK